MVLVLSPLHRINIATTPFTQDENAVLFIDETNEIYFLVVASVDMKTAIINNEAQSVATATGKLNRIIACANKQKMKNSRHVAEFQRVMAARDRLLDDNIATAQRMLKLISTKPPT